MQIRDKTNGDWIRSMPAAIPAGFSLTNVHRNPRVRARYDAICPN